MDLKALVDEAYQVVINKIDRLDQNKYRFELATYLQSINKYIIVHDNILSKNCQKVESSMIGPSYLPGTYLMNFTIEKKKCRCF